MFCLCADGFEGKNCETGEKLSRRAALLPLFHAANGTSAAALVKNSHCYEGLGLFLRGNSVPVREWADLPGLGSPDPGALLDL